MDRKEVIEFLEIQLKKLKEEEHVEDLMKHGRVDELKQVAQKEVDCSPLEAFCYKDNLNLDVHEIPMEDYLYEMVFYVMNSELSDYQVFSEYSDFIILLENKKEELATKIGGFMQSIDLNNIQIEDLIE